jgi:hypothetical protein
MDFTFLLLTILTSHINPNYNLQPTLAPKNIIIENYSSLPHEITIELNGGYINTVYPYRIYCVYKSSKYGSLLIGHIYIVDDFNEYLNDYDSHYEEYYMLFTEPEQWTCVFKYITSQHTGYGVGLQKVGQFILNKY